MSEQQNTTPEMKQEPRFQPFEVLFALLGVVFAFLFLKYTFAVTVGVALTGTVALFVAGTLLYQGLRKQKITLASLFWAAVILVFSLTFFLTDNGFLKGWCVVFEILTMAYWIYLSFGNRSAKAPDDMLGFDLLKSLLLLPFGNIHQGFASIGSITGKGKKALNLLYIFLGLVLATVPTAIIFAILLQGDSAFANLMENIFKNFDEVFGRNIGCLIMAIPLGMLIYGLWYGAAEKRFSHLLTREAKDRGTRVLRFAPSALVCAALTPILGIYILFFISQAGYFFDAFQNLIPEGYTIAQYAREGFFNLVWVCVINAVIILAVHFFTHRTGKNGYSVFAKLYVVLFSLSSILLAVIALRKMILYIDYYGMTKNRIYAAWFILLLSVFFLLLILKQFIPKFNGIFAGLVAFILLFGGLCLVNVDARIAEYNLNRYIAAQDVAESTVELDLDMMYDDLSDAAIVAVDKAYDRLDGEGKTKADEFFRKHAETMNRNLGKEERYSRYYSFRSWNLDTARAETILKERYPGVFTNKEYCFGWTW